LLYLIVSVLIQVALVVHIVKTGRDTKWIWIVTMLPRAGALAYLVVEVLPGVLRRRQSPPVQPERDITPAQSESRPEGYLVDPALAHLLDEGEALLQAERYHEASEFYEARLTGTLVHQPDLMHGLARAEFALQHFARARQVLDQLIEFNPDFKHPDGHLLYARTLEALNETTAARHEYQVLHNYYPGAEASLRFAQFEQALGNRDECQRLLQSLLERAQQAGDDYQKQQESWLAEARQMLNDRPE